MIRVYVREDTDSDGGVFLGKFRSGDLEELIGLFKKNETFVWEEGYPCKYLFSQFVLYNAGASFEIVVYKPDDK